MSTAHMSGRPANRKRSVRPCACASPERLRVAGGHCPRAPWRLGRVKTAKCPPEKRTYPEMENFHQRAAGSGEKLRLRAPREHFAVAVPSLRIAVRSRARGLGAGLQSGPEGILKAAASRYPRPAGFCRWIKSPDGPLTQSMPGPPTCDRDSGVGN
jgi:hypothetical protein